LLLPHFPQESAAQAGQRIAAGEILLRRHPGGLVDGEDRVVEMKHALLPDGRGARRAQRQLHPIAGAHHAGEVSHPFPADEGASAQDRFARGLFADGPAADDEVEQRLVVIGDQPEPRGSPPQPFSTTRTGNLLNAEQTMPSGPARRSKNTPLGASATAPGPSGMRSSFPAADVSSTSSPDPWTQTNARSASGCFFHPVFWPALR